MSSALPYLLLGLFLAIGLCTIAWLRNLRPRTPLKSVDEFHSSLRALAPKTARARRPA